MLMLITPSNPYNNNNFVGGKPILKKTCPQPILYCDWFYPGTDGWSSMITTVYNTWKSLKIKLKSAEKIYFRGGASYYILMKDYEWFFSL